MSFLKSGWVLFGLIALSFVAMIVLMVKSTGDYPYQATVETSVHANPGAEEPVIGSLAAGAVLMCHPPRAAHPDWLDCSDMIERKFILLDAMSPISQEAYDEAKKAAGPGG